MASKDSKRKVEDYGRVFISLENSIIPSEKLEKTPSSYDGLCSELETDLRIVGCEYIQSAGILLKLPQVAMATGQVLFQRFYYSKSFIRHDVEVYAMACLFLAAKIEESPRRIRDVINVFHHIKQHRNMKPITPMEYMGNTYFTLKNLVIKAERRILKELGFCVHVQHPHKVIITFLQVLECQDNQRLAQLAWNYMNDALRTNVFVRYQPETIACACISLSARVLKIPLPSRPPWWELFDSTVEEIHDVSMTLLKLYQRPKITLQNLNKAVDQLKKAKKISESTTNAKDDSKTKKKSSNGSTFSQSGSPNSNQSPLGESSKFGESSKSRTKNGSTKSSESREATTSKKSSKTQETRKDNDKNNKSTKRARSAGSDKSHSASGSDTESDNSSDSDASGSSPEDKKRRGKLFRRQNHEIRREKHDDVRNKKLQKSKSDTNTGRRQRERSRSPHRPSRSKSPRDRRGGKLKDKYVRRVDSKDSRRNGDYKACDKRERSGAR